MISFFKLEEKQLNPFISFSSWNFVNNSSTPIINIATDWNPIIPHSLVVSHKNGFVSLVSFQPDQVSCLSSFKAHDFEVWSATWDSFEANVFYTGSDDCFFKAWDQRQTLNRPISSCSFHSAGVCCLQPHPSLDHILCSSSYDESLCVWDKRAGWRKPLQKIELGGGVWKFKFWNPLQNSSQQDLIAAACMHNGFQLIHLDISQNQASIFASHSQGKAIEQGQQAPLAYGVDWCYLGDKSFTKKFICSCSFYDHCLQMWSADVSFSF